MEAYLVCCLCSYRAPDESDLEVHIDSDHSDIFRSALNLSDIKTEDVPITEVYQPPSVYQQSSVYQTSPVYQTLPQVQSTSYQPSLVYQAPTQIQSTTYQLSPVYQTPPQVQSTSYQAAAQALSSPYLAYSQVTPQTNQQYYQQQYSEQGSSMSHEYLSQPYINEAPAQVTPNVENKQDSDGNTNCPYCPYSNTRSKILQNHINKKHPDEHNNYGQFLSDSLPPQTNVTPTTAKNSRKRQSLPSDLTTIHSKKMQSAKRDKNHDSTTTFINTEEKYSGAPTIAQVVAQQSMESNIETPVQSHSGKQSKKHESATLIKMDEKYRDAPSNPQGVAQQVMRSNIETPVQNQFSKQGKTNECATLIKMDEKYRDYPTNAQIATLQPMGSNIERLGQSQLSKRGKKHEPATFIKIEEKYSDYPTDAQVVALGSTIKTPVLSHSLPFLLPKNHTNEINSDFQAQNTVLKIEENDTEISWPSNQQVEKNTNPYEVKSLILKDEKIGN